MSIWYWYLRAPGPLAATPCAAHKDLAHVDLVLVPARASARLSVNRVLLPAERPAPRRPTVLVPARVRSPGAVGGRSGAGRGAEVGRKWTRIGGGSSEVCMCVCVCARARARPCARTCGVGFGGARVVSGSGEARAARRRRDRDSASPARKRAGRGGVAAAGGKVPATGAHVHAPAQTRIGWAGGERASRRWVGGWVGGWVRCA